MISPGARKGKTKKFFKICPRCGSTNIGQNTDALVAGSTLLDNCKNCGFGAYGNQSFPEIEKLKIPSFRNMLRQRK